jgi:N-acyl-L-homoserine lactone synthetase
MRSASTVSSRRLLLLAPTLRAVPDSFTQLRCDARAHEDVLAETQRFRGQVYLQDGAIKPWQLVDGRHRLEMDQGSWHLLVLDPNGNVCGCARF